MVKFNFNFQPVKLKTIAKATHKLLILLKYIRRRKLLRKNNPYNDNLVIKKFPNLIYGGMGL